MIAGSAALRAAEPAIITLPASLAFVIIRRPQMRSKGKGPIINKL
jgi:hypothetical protein